MSGANKKGRLVGGFFFFLLYKFKYNGRINPAQIFFDLKWSVITILVTLGKWWKLDKKKQGMGFRGIGCRKAGSR